MKKNAIKVGQGLVILAMIYSVAGCLVSEPREGYYDRDHHRYYHERAWHECAEHDHFCN